MDNASVGSAQVRLMPDNIPVEMRSFRQFVVWRYERRNGETKPTKVPYAPLTGLNASVSDAQSWASFDQAVAASANYDGIGFVFAESDPFAGIDLDDTQGVEADLARQHRLFDHFISYAERSPSGKGLHIIAKGSVPKGRRRAQIEIYSSNRFFTMTGDTFRNVPIADYHTELNLVWNAMRPVSEREATIYDGPEREVDSAILERMFNAENGAKARNLFEGRYQLHFESQSQADLALMDILAFYTDNREQIARIFASSALSARDKADRRKYIADMIDKSFDRKLPTLDAPEVIAQAKAFADSQAAIEAIGLTPFDAPSDDLMPTFDVGDFDGAPKPRPWFVEGLIPARNVTLLNSDGGGGKSLLMAQLCAATRLARPWLGLPLARSGAALFLTAEDEREEVERRMFDIARAEGVRERDLRGVVVASLADRDALLAAPGRVRGTLEATPLFGALAARIASLRPALVVIDTLADTFGGDEISRSQARWFIAQLRRLAIDFDTTVIVLAHPSQSGMERGTGTSGSTAWSNSVRSRLYLTRDEKRPNVSTLELKKANYSAVGQRITLRWERGVFWAIEHAQNAHAHKEASESAIDELFVAILADFTARGQQLSRSHNSKDYAPRLFEKHDKANGANRFGFQNAMNRLFANHRIRETTVGFSSKSKSIIVINDDAEPTSGSPSGSVPGCFDSPSGSPSGSFQVPFGVSAQHHP